MRKLSDIANTDHITLKLLQERGLIPDKDKPSQLCFPKQIMLP